MSRFLDWPKARRHPEFAALFHGDPQRHRLYRALVTADITGLPLLRHWLDTDPRVLLDIRGIGPHALQLLEQIADTAPRPVYAPADFTAPAVSSERAAAVTVGPGRRVAGRLMRFTDVDAAPASAGVVPSDGIRSTDYDAFHHLQAATPAGAVRVGLLTPPARAGRSGRHTPAGVRLRRHGRSTTVGAPTQGVATRWWATPVPTWSNSRGYEAPTQGVTAQGTAVVTQPPFSSRVRTGRTAERRRGGAGGLGRRAVQTTRLIHRPCRATCSACSADAP